MTRGMGSIAVETGTGRYRARRKDQAARFKVSSEADVTVVLYREHKVIANHAFRNGELNDKAIDKILADVPRLVQKK